VTVVQLVLCLACIDLLRPQCSFRENGDTLRQYFNEAACDVEAFATLIVAAVKPNLSRPKLREQGSMAVKNLKIAGLRRNFDRVHRLINEDTIGSYEPDAQCVGIRHIDPLTP
jgi:hypothetical protein